MSEISEPLAEGRFSILYISTYQTDFVLVSESKLHSAINALRQDGFEVEYDGDDEISSYPYTAEEEEDDAIDIPLSPVDPTQFLVDTEVLVNELQCVGLNRHYRSDWVTIVLKILCYPDLMQGCR
ncbi:MAG: ACT domain-containing protein [Paenibacillus sp.]|nr:ACT domain-containing protein [Paenibacillus sp.]